MTVMSYECLESCSRCVGASVPRPHLGSTRLINISNHTSHPTEGQFEMAAKMWWLRPSGRVKASNRRRRDGYRAS